MITAYRENAARRNVRLKAERSTRKANNLAAYLAKRERERGNAASADVQEQCAERFENGAGI